jgi:serine/threonine protein kinase
MTSTRWQEIKRVLDVVGEVAPKDRPGALTAACAGDQDLRREVESLLSFEEKAAALDRPAQPAGAAGVPERIGPYRVEGLLGAGGMGAVYLAVRDDDQYRKQVAIKVIPTAGDPDLLSRFRAERQIVAGLEHPYIARLLDGGALADGRPYFVMEHIAGQRIDAYTAEKKLDTAAILRLFLKVCSAVQFAHRIHLTTASRESSGSPSSHHPKCGPENRHAPSLLERNQMARSPSSLLILVQMKQVGPYCSFQRNGTASFTFQCPYSDSST